jgi:VWFA-related protein
MLHASCFMTGSTRRTAGRRVVVVLAAMMLGAVPVAQEQPTFRAGTTLVEVSAIVTRDGRPVTDLRRDELRVLDNGVEQPLVAFEYVDLTTVEGPAQRRDFVLVVDDLHILPQFTAQVRDVAAALLRELGPHDRLGLVTTGPHQVVVDPTTDREAVQTGLERVRGQQPSGATTSLELEMRARSAFDVIRSVADSLKGDASERRTIVLVSEGHHVLPDGVGRLNDDPAVLAMYLDVIRDAALANVAIYAIDPRGLIAPSSGMSAGGGVASSVAAAMQGGAASSMARRRFGSLGTIAMHTGGTLTVDTNDLTADIPHIVRDSRRYYRLAYVQPEPAEGKRQPRTRAIEVKVDRRGVEVRARQRYAPR